jgi:uncharacterized protein YndB with AHSA1/START domain
MVDILHRVAAQSPTPEKVYRALTTVDGLAGWWTDETTGSGELGGVLQFRFYGGRGGADMEVLELRPDERVVWRVVDGPAEWIGTTVEFSLKQEDDYTVVLFAHRGWREPVEFMHHCSTRWGGFLMSLKSLVETGEGAPAPKDVSVGNWR